MQKVVIGLGSNLGNRQKNLSLARQLISERVGEIVQQSSIAETESWGFEAPSFLNQALIVQTSMAPLELLDCLQTIERELGRTSKTQILDGHPVYSSRTIDLDILDYGGLSYHDERLTLPHSQIAHRDFVIDELAELGVLDKIVKRNPRSEQ